MTRAALYCRVSTEEQAQHHGIEGQRERLREYARRQGYHIVEEFIDDGWSGGSLDRPGMDRLRRAVADGLVDVVLAYDPDRLARDLADLLLLDRELQRAGVRLETITTENDGSPEGRMFFQFKGAFAEYERAVILRRTSEGRRRKARQGKVVNPRNLPRWLRYNRERDTVELDEEWAQVARLAFTLVDEEGMTLAGLARRLRELGVPTPGGGTHWQPMTLRNWLRNPAAKGEYCQFRYERVEPRRRRRAGYQRRRSSKRERPREEWIVVPVPPIVTPERWARVQERLERNKALAARNTRREYLLRGLVRCGACGSRLSGGYARGRYYRCSRHRDHRVDIHGNFCSLRPVWAEPLEREVWHAITGLLQEPERLREELRQRCEEGSPTREATEQELTRARRRLESIPREMDRLVEGYSKGLIPDDRMKARMEGLKQERERLQVRSAELERQLSRMEVTQEQEAQALAFAERVRHGLENLSSSERRELLRLLVEDVTCYEGRAVVRTIIPMEQPQQDVHLHKPHRERVRVRAGARDLPRPPIKNSGDTPETPAGGFAPYAPRSSVP